MALPLEKSCLKLQFAHVGHINIATLGIRTTKSLNIRWLTVWLTAKVGQINYDNELSQLAHGKTGNTGCFKKLFMAKQ